MADYYCDDCQTNQCKLCESLLHTTQLTDIVQIDDCFNHWHHRRPLLSLSNHSLTNELSSLSSSSGVLLPENSNSEEEEDKSNCSKQIDLNNITLARKKTSSSTTKSVTNKVSTTDLIQQPPPPIIINKNQNNLHNIQLTNHEKILSTSPLSDPIVEDDFDENDNDNDDIVEQRVDNIELSSAETSNTASTTLSTTTTTTNNSKSKKKKKRQQQQLQQQQQQQQNTDKKTIIDDGDDDDIGDGSITSTLLNKKKIITSTIVNNNTNDANKKHTSSSSSSTSLSSDPSSSDDSSEGYVSSTTITKNRHRKSTIATNQTSLTTAPSTTTTASMTMTNGGRDLKSTTTTTSTKQPSSSSLLMPLDTDDPLLDFDIDNNNGGSNGKNGWSDVNLSTTPPKSTFDSSPNIMDNNHNHQHQQILLPDVAQLSLGNSSSSSPPPSSSLSSNQAATLKLNGYKKNRTNSESSSASSSSTISDQNLAEFSDPNQNDDQYDESTYKPDCFLLIDAEEVLQVKTVEEFIAKLGCQSNTLVKVVSIFGNTGEGKSHTLNYTFYDCKEVFRTSPTQNSCTIGIWCSFDRRRRVLTIDTEGLLGLSDNNNRRTRLLLKVLAISDVIIYRTRAERLHNDLFTFLGSASQAYIKHFAKELRAASQRCNLQCTLSDLGPVVIIFHETVHTDVLHQGKFF